MKILGRFIKGEFVPDNRGRLEYVKTKFDGDLVVMEVYKPRKNNPDILLRQLQKERYKYPEPYENT